MPDPADICLTLEIVCETEPVYATLETIGFCGLSAKNPSATVHTYMYILRKPCWETCREYLSDHSLGSWKIVGQGLCPPRELHTSLLSVGPAGSLRRARETAKARIKNGETELFTVGSASRTRIIRGGAGDWP